MSGLTWNVAANGPLPVKFVTLTSLNHLLDIPAKNTFAPGCGLDANPDTLIFAPVSYTHLRAHET